MSIEFPISEIKTDLGKVIDPTIPISVLTKFGYRVFDFLVDTGADCTMLPNSMANILGINLSSCKRTSSFGIEGSSITCHITKIHIKLNNIKLKIKCLISGKDTTPLILGRIDIFSKFNIIFDNRSRKIKFIKIK